MKKLRRITPVILALAFCLLFGMTVMANDRFTLEGGNRQRVGIKVDGMGRGGAWLSCEDAEDPSSADMERITGSSDYWAYTMNLTLQDENGAPVVLDQSLPEYIELRFYIPTVTSNVRGVRVLRYDEAEGAWENAENGNDSFWGDVFDVAIGRNGMVRMRLSSVSRICILVPKNTENAAFGLMSSSVIVMKSGQPVDPDALRVMVQQAAAEQALSSEEAAAVTGSSKNYTVHLMNVNLLDENSQPVTLGEGEYVDLEFVVPGVRPDSEVRILHYDGSVWEMDSAQVLAQDRGYVKGRFTSLSPVAVLVYNENTGSSGGSGRSRHSGSPEPERTFWATPLSSGAAVMVNGAPADLQIGPATRTFSEADAQVLLGTGDACNVYMADLWLLDQASKNIVLPDAGGALVTLRIPGVTKGSNVKVRQWLNGTDEYVDLLPEKIGEGYVCIRFSAMGQVAVCTSGTGNTAAEPAGAAGNL